MKKATHCFFIVLTLTGILLAEVASQSADSSAFLKPPGLRLVKDPSVVIPDAHHYLNRKLQLPRYRGASGAPLKGWWRELIKTRRFSSDQSAWVYYRRSDLKKALVIKTSGLPGSMRIWPAGATLILEGYKGDVGRFDDQRLLEIEVMTKMDSGSSAAGDTYFPVNWSYARFNPQGARALSTEKLNECHQCHSIAFRLTGDLIFTAFPY